MTQTTLRFPFGKEVAKKPSQEAVELQQALTRTSAEIHQTYHAFDNTCEDELIESYVFQINALHARYNYLLRRIKESEEAL